MHIKSVYSDLSIFLDPTLVENVPYFSGLCSSQWSETESKIVTFDFPLSVLQSYVDIRQADNIPTTNIAKQFWTFDGLDPSSELIYAFTEFIEFCDYLGDTEMLEAIHTTLGNRQRTDPIAVLLENLFNAIRTSITGVKYMQYLPPVEFASKNPEWFLRWFIKTHDDITDALSVYIRGYSKSLTKSRLSKDISTPSSMPIIDLIDSMSRLCKYVPNKKDLRYLKSNSMHAPIHRTPRKV